MEAHVTFMGVLASLTGEKQCRMQAEVGTTLRRLLEQFEARYGEEFGQRAFGPPLLLDLSRPIPASSSTTG